MDRIQVFTLVVVRRSIGRRGGGSDFFFSWISVTLNLLRLCMDAMKTSPALQVPRARLVWPYVQSGEEEEGLDITTNFLTTICAQRRGRRCDRDTQQDCCVLGDLLIPRAPARPARPPRRSTNERTSREGTLHASQTSIPGLRADDLLRGDLTPPVCAPFSSRLRPLTSCLSPPPLPRLSATPRAPRISSLGSQTAARRIFTSLGRGRLWGRDVMIPSPSTLFQIDSTSALRRVQATSRAVNGGSFVPPTPALSPPPQPQSPRDFSPRPSMAIVSVKQNPPIHPVAHARDDWRPDAGSGEIALAEVPIEKSFDLQPRTGALELEVRDPTCPPSHPPI
ncbi:hypothetical protein K438DRAFT_2024171 [Mycena galopus ATCC 62051]|nr:hypothetical protein K438DRAFT_2024171 [Mycena galopus ATCC 62051]